MKKAVFWTVLWTILLLGTWVSAASVEYTDAAQGIISVSGAATSGENVSILILHEGYGTADIPDHAAEAQEYVASQICSGNAYSFTIRLIPKNSNEKEVFTFIISRDGIAETWTWEYYPTALKLEEIEKLNRAEDFSQIQDCIESLYAAYGVSGHPLGAEAYADGAAEALFTLKQRAGTFPEDVNQMMQNLRGAMLVGAYNAHAADVLITDDTLNYVDILNLTDSEYDKDYRNALSTDGRNALHQALISGSYDSVAEITKQFQQQVLYHVLMSYKEAGFAQFDTCFAKYRDDYLAAGFHLDTSVSGKNAIYTALLRSSATSLTALAAEYNKLVAESQVQNNTAGGSAGGGGGGIGGSTLSSDLENGQGYVPQNTDSKEQQGDVFWDLDSVPWAQDAIEELYQAGVINGKEANLFYPEDNVTRAEFAKMLVIVCNLNETQAQSFTDMEGHWAEIYVSACAAAELVNGYEDGSFQPERDITREQGVVMVYRAVLQQNIKPDDGKREFIDQDEISDYAEKAVSVMAYNKVINGTDENCFMPANALTRAEAAVLLRNVKAYIARQ